MAGEIAKVAVARINAALDRIEAAVARPATRLAPADSQLEQRHERLRAAVTDTLRELDGVIAGSPPGSPPGSPE